MKKALSLLGIGVLLSTGIVATSSDDPAWAAANPATLTLDCTDNTSLVASLADETWPGTANVIDALVDDDILITASGGNCVVANVVGNEALTISDGTVEVGTTSAADDLVVANSGAFTVTPVSGAPVTVYIDACSLEGSGNVADPWLVATADDLKLVGQESSSAGENSCSLAGHYLQTANISDIDTSVDSTFRIGDFSGVYDGDHYRLSYSSFSSGGAYASRGPVFDTITGTVKRLRLTGTIRTTNGPVGSLAGLVGDGAVISEIDSRVALEVSDHDAKVGGLVAEIQNASARIQYSRFSGSVTWEPSGNSNRFYGPTIGGLFGQIIGSSSVVEIRDSYALPEVTFDSSNLTPSVTNYDLAAILVGGLVGSIGIHAVSFDSDRDGIEDGSAGGEARIIRSYAVSSINNTCEGNTFDCFTASSRRVFSGGLVGLVGGLEQDDPQDIDNAVDLQSDGDSLSSELTIVSSFWLTSSTTSQAVGVIPSGLATSSAVDNLSSDPLPVAVPLSASELRTLSSFTTEEDPEISGNPGGEEIVIAASNRTSASAADYRWAITNERSTFVPSTYTLDAVTDPGTVLDQENFFNRALYDPANDGAKEYLRLRAGVLDAYGGDDPRSTTTYTTLGNVWEICAGRSFPTLVWEERTCGDGGSGNTTSSRDDDDEEMSAAESAAALGLSEAEYAAFLASGLTLEEFLASRLAATGPSRAMVSLSTYSVLALFAMGGILLWWSRRYASAR